MKKFKYSMQSILNIKEKIEVQEKLAFQNAMNSLNEENDKLKALETRQTAYENTLRKLISSNIDIVKVKQCKDSIEMMKEMVKQQKNAVRKAEQYVEIARSRLKTAMIERKTHETLRERALNEYMMQLDAEERKEVDEQTSYKYMQRNEVDD